MATHAVQINQYRTTLLEQLRTGNEYEFCAAVGPYLEVRPNDTYVRLMAVRSYLKLNLIEPAQGLINEGLGNDAASAQLLEARRAMRSLPRSRRAWEDHRALFEANLAVLSARGCETASIRDAWAEQRSCYDLFKDRSGEFQVRHRGAGGDWHWYPGLGRHSVTDEHRALPDDVGSGFPGPYLIDGLGLGHYFERLYVRTTRTFLNYSCALYIVERDPARVAVVFHLRDWSEILTDPRVMLFTGDGAVGALVTALERDTCLPLPVQVMQTGAVFDAPKSDAVSWITSLSQARQSAIRASLADIENRYADRGIQYWASRFDEAVRAAAPPLRILAVVSRHTTFLKYSMRDAQRALESLGHSCIVLTEDDDHRTISPLAYHQAMREHDPDLFFCLDHLRSEFGAIIPANLPVLTWDQDQLPHVITKENLASIARFDFIVGCSRQRCVMLGVSPSQLLHARVPTSPEQFAGEALCPEEMERFSCDVSYVSHASQTPRAFHEQERSRSADAKVASLLDAIFEIVPDAVGAYRVLDGFAMSEVLAAACERCGVASLDPAMEGRLRNWYVWRLADRIFRHQALEWVGRWARARKKSFRIYGSGWEEHPALAEFAAGPVENGRELVCVYRASRINLQLMPAGFIHQRALDGLAAGGFFLTRLVPHDLHGGSFEALDRRMRELGIEDSDELLAVDDPMIRRHLAAVLGPFASRRRPDAFDLVEWVRTAAELRYPDQVFEEFNAITFDSAGQFARLADTFVGDPSLRARLANRMRRVVVEQFSYRPAMARFLEAMRDHLCREAAM